MVNPTGPAPAIKIGFLLIPADSFFGAQEPSGIYSSGCEGTGVKRLLALLVLLSFPVLARTRTIVVVIPLPQQKFPPKWTQTIHVTLADEDDSVSDHRYFKAGSKEFRAVLKGKIPNQKCEIEVMCLSKGEKHISIFRQTVRIQPDTKGLKLNQLRFIETINQP